MRPVCVKCNVEMRAERNGVVVYHEYERPEPGPIQEEGTFYGVKANIIHVDRMLDPSLFNSGRIDFIVNGDKYKCPLCGHEIVTGFGRPMGDYEVKQEQLRSMILNAPEKIEIFRKRRKELPGVTT